jgi:hypothetical protein
MNNTTVKDSSIREKRRIFFKIHDYCPSRLKKKVIAPDPFPDKGGPRLFSPPITFGWFDDEE